MKKLLDTYLKTIGTTRNEVSVEQGISTNALQRASEKDAESINFNILEGIGRMINRKPGEVLDELIKFEKTFNPDTIILARQHNYLESIYKQKRNLERKIKKYAFEQLDLDGDGKVGHSYSEKEKEENDSGKNTPKGLRLKRLEEFIKYRDANNLDVVSSTDAASIAQINYPEIYAKHEFPEGQEPQFSKNFTQWTKVRGYLYGDGRTMLVKINEIISKFGDAFISAETSPYSMTTYLKVKASFFDDKGRKNLFKINDVCGRQDLFQVVTDEALDSDTVTVRIGQTTIFSANEKERMSGLAINGDINIYIRPESPDEGGDTNLMMNKAVFPGSYVYEDKQWIDKIKDDLRLNNVKRVKPFKEETKW